MPDKIKADSDFLEQFEPDVFWAQHGRKVMLGAGALVAVGLIALWWQRQAAQSDAEAAARLATAADPSALAGIIQEYRGKDVAGQAMIRLADTQFQAGNYPAAAEAYQNFLGAFPNHPLRDSAQLGLAAVQEAQGDLEAAKMQYLQIVASRPTGYTTIAARMAAARCAEALGQTKDALQMYEELLPITQNSPWQMEAYLRWTVLSRSRESAVTNQPGNPIESPQPLSLSPTPAPVQ